MPKFKMVALTNPVEGQEDAYNDWYQNTHLPEMLAYDGMKSAQRYKVAAPLQDPVGYNYMCIYDIETDDLMAMLQKIGGDAAAGKNTMTDAADNANAYTVIFNEFGEEVTHDQAVAKVGAR